VPDSSSGPPLTIKHLLIDKKTDFPQWSLSHKKFCPFSNLWRKFYFCFYCDFKRANVEWMKNHFTSEKADFDPLCLKRHKSRKNHWKSVFLWPPSDWQIGPSPPSKKIFQKKTRDWIWMYAYCMCRPVCFVESFTQCWPTGWASITNASSQPAVKWAISWTLSPAFVMFTMLVSNSSSLLHPASAALRRNPSTDHYKS